MPFPSTFIFVSTVATLLFLGKHASFHCGRKRPHHVPISHMPVMAWNSDNSGNDAGKANVESKNGSQSHTGFCREEKRNVCQVEKDQLGKKIIFNFEASLQMKKNQNNSKQPQILYSLILTQILSWGHSEYETEAITFKLNTSFLDGSNYGLSPSQCVRGTAGNFTMQLGKAVCQS